MTPPDKAIQGAYAGVFKGTEFRNGIYLVFRPLLHRALFILLFEVSQSGKYKRVEFSENRVGKVAYP